MNRLHRWYCRSSHWHRELADLVPWALNGVPLGDRVLELGAGPGGATPWLSAPTRRLTTLDIDARTPTMASRPFVHAVRGDARALPFRDNVFSTIVAFTMLHHVPTPADQDRVFAEAARALRPGGLFVALDVRPGVALRLAHLGDTWMPVPHETLEPRLVRAGFRDVSVESRHGWFRCVAARPLPLV
jgi:SAM-dependent methyltransferase